MSNKDIVFYKDNKAVLVDFEGDKIRSEGGLILRENRAETPYNQVF